MILVLGDLVKKEPGSHCEMVSEWMQGVRFNSLLRVLEIKDFHWYPVKQSADRSRRLTAVLGIQIVWFNRVETN